MAKVLDVIKNINTLYSSSNGLSVLQDFERVFDTLNLYTYENWIDGELVLGPTVSRHWVECGFMWPAEKMPDPSGAKVLGDYGCSVVFKRDVFSAPKKVKSPEDFEEGTKKGKIEDYDVWIVEVKMPKKLMKDVFRGYNALVDARVKKQNERTDLASDTKLEEPELDNIGGIV